MSETSSSSTTGSITTPVSDELTVLLNIMNEALTVTARAPSAAINVLSFFPAGFSVSRLIRSPQISRAAAVPRLIIVESLISP